MFGAIIVGVVGLVCVFFGYLIWMKQKIGLLHDYHYNKVSDADKKAFCTLMGIGVMLIGVGLLVTAVILAVVKILLSFLAFAVGFAAGLALLIYAGRKYNKD